MNEEKRSGKEWLKLIPAKWKVEILAKDKGWNMSEKISKVEFEKRLSKSQIKCNMEMLKAKTIWS